MVWEITSKQTENHHTNEEKSEMLLFIWVKEHLPKIMIDSPSFVCSRIFHPLALIIYEMKY